MSNNNNNNIGCLFSWPAIIIALLCFWPVGLVLLIKRISLDKRTAMKAGGKGLKTLGICLAAFGALGFIGCVTDTSGDSTGGAIVGLFFIVGGIFLMRKAKKMDKEADSIKQYLNIIVNGGERQIDVIAAATGKQYDVVKNDIQKMIDKGFLKNAYININTREVVLPTSAPANINVVSPAQATTVAAAVQTRVVACPCCGANNTVTGAVGECEYCGTSLS